MSATNGHARKSWLARLQDLEESWTGGRRRLASLPPAQPPAPQRQPQQLRESWPQQDYLGLLTDYVRSLSARFPFEAGAPGNFAHKKRGNNWPMVQSQTDLYRHIFASRVLYATSPNAKGLIAGLEAYVLGDGLTYRIVGKKHIDPNEVKPIVTAAQQLVDDDLRRNDWHGGEQPGLESEFFVRSRRDGEALLRPFPKEDGTTQRRFVDSFQLMNPLDRSELDGWWAGVGTHPNDVAGPRKYWVSLDGDAAHGEEIDDDELLHFRVNVDRIEKRGMPDLGWGVYDLLNLNHIALRNIGEATGQQAAIVYVMQHAVGTSTEVRTMVDARENSIQEPNWYSGILRAVERMVGGRHEHIPKHQEYKEPPSARNVPNHLEALAALLRACGRPWQAPEWLTSGDASNNNYASSLVAESPFVLIVKSQQRRYCSALREDVWNALKHAIKVRGLRVRMPSLDGVTPGEAREFDWETVEQLIDLEVTAPNPEARDKQVDASADETLINLGVKSRQMAAEERGYEWDRVEKDNEEYEAAHPQPMMGPDGQPMGPGGDEDGEQEDDEDQPPGGGGGPGGYVDLDKEEMQEAFLEQGRFDASKHKRAGKGTKEGGQFTKGGGTPSARKMSPRVQKMHHELQHTKMYANLLADRLHREHPSAQPSFRDIHRISRGLAKRSGFGTQDVSDEHIDQAVKHLARAGGGGSGGTVSKSPLARHAPPDEAKGIDYASYSRDQFHAALSNAVKRAYPSANVSPDVIRREALKLHANRDKISPEITNALIDKLGGGNKLGTVSKARGIWRAVKGTAVKQFHKLSEHYGKAGATAIVATAALPIPGTALAPAAALLLANVAKKIKDGSLFQDKTLQAQMGKYGVQEQDESDDAPAPSGDMLDSMAGEVLRLVRWAHQQTGEEMPQVKAKDYKELLADHLRGDPLTEEFDPNEPRDERGRWTAVDDDGSEQFTAIPVGEMRTVRGFKVRRTAEDDYRIETQTGKGSVRGSLADVQAHIDREHAGQRAYGKLLRDALARTEDYDEPDWTQGDRLDAAAVAFAKLPAGTAVVSLEPETYGRTGKIVRDEEGRKRVKLDGQDGYSSSHVEPLDQRHSWRKPAAPSTPKPYQPKLFEAKSSGGGRWITIGGTEDEEGNRKGGSPVYIENGRITKGHPSLTGKKIGELGKKGDGGEDKGAPGHRKQLQQSRDYATAKIVKQARQEGINSEHLHQLAAEMMEHDGAFTQEKRNMLRDARQALKRFGGQGKALHLIAGRGDVDADSIKGLDDVAQEMAHNYPEFFRDRNQHDSDVLYAMLVAGEPGQMSETDAYEQALDYLREHGAASVADLSNVTIPEEFDPNQPRDDAGRWVKGPAGTASQAAGAIRGRQAGKQHYRDLHAGAHDLTHEDLKATAKHFRLHQGGSQPQLAQRVRDHVAWQLGQWGETPPEPVYGEPEADDLFLTGQGADLDKPGTGSGDDLFMGEEPGEVADEPKPQGDHAKKLNPIHDAIAEFEAAGASDNLRALHAASEKLEAALKQHNEGKPYVHGGKQYQLIIGGGAGSRPIGHEEKITPRPDRGAAFRRGHVAKSIGGTPGEIAAAMSNKPTPTNPEAELYKAARDPGGPPPGPAKVRAADVDTPAQGVLNDARKQKAAAFKRVKELRQRIKDEPLGGNRHGLRMELLKAESAHGDAIRSEREALGAIERRASELGQTTQTAPPAPPPASTPGAGQAAASDSADSLHADFDRLRNAPSHEVKAWADKLPKQSVATLKGLAQKLELTTDGTRSDLAKRIAGTLQFVNTSAHQVAGIDRDIKPALKPAETPAGQPAEVKTPPASPGFAFHPDIPVHVRGDTFRHKDTLKAHGGRWDDEARAWVFKQDVARILKSKNLEGLTFSMPKDAVQFYHPEFGKEKKESADDDYEWNGEPTLDVPEGE